jgi:hypothetical protein
VWNHARNLRRRSDARSFASDGAGVDGDFELPRRAGFLLLPLTAGLRAAMLALLFFFAIFFAVFFELLAAAIL